MAAPKKSAKATAKKPKASPPLGDSAPTPKKGAKAKGSTTPRTTDGATAELPRAAAETIRVVRSLRAKMDAAWEALEDLPASREEERSEEASTRAIAAMTAAIDEAEAVWSVLPEEIREGNEPALREMRALVDRKNAARERAKTLLRDFAANTRQRYAFALVGVVKYPEGPAGVPVAVLDPTHVQTIAIPADTSLVGAAEVLHVAIETPLKAQSTYGMHWAARLLRAGPGALLDGYAELYSRRAMSEFPGSVLAAVSDAVSRPLRRQLLLEELNACGWNMARCSERLRMGGAGNVLRAIRDLDLTEQHEAAKAAGLVRVGGRTAGERRRPTE